MPMAARGYWTAGLGMILLLLAARPAGAQPVPRGRIVPVAVVGERCECVLPTPRSDEKYLLIVGSLARGPGPYQVSIRTQTADGPALVPWQPAIPDPNWERRVHELNDRLAWARQTQPAIAEYPPSADPPRQRVFYLFASGHNFQDPSSHIAVAADLQAVGRRCQVYVDRTYRDLAGLRPTIDDIIRTFDQEVYPQARLRLGHVQDVDRDGRFTILLTSWLARMQDGKVALGGFVRGSDFYRDGVAPQSNRCDMMYLNTDLRPGPYLRSILAHEYTHAVVFSEHLFGSYLPDAPRQDEESWLNEGLAHLAEDVAGYSWSNLDYRISAFLSSPERYQLVVPDYYGAGLWRSHGNRGATYLFLRWCADESDAELLGRVIRTNLTGVVNVETATHRPFAELFRQWTAALAVSGTGLPAEGLAPLRRLDLHQPLGGRLLCGPRWEEVPLAGGDHPLRLAGTSAAYLLLHSSAGSCAHLTVTAEAETNLQVTLIRLPEQAARLSLQREAGTTPGTIRLLVTVHDSDVLLDAAGWERLIPTTNTPEDSSYRTDEPPGTPVARWFGDPHMRAGETRSSTDIPLPPLDGLLIFKVAGTDSAGHRAAAWTVAAPGP